VTNFGALLYSFFGQLFFCKKRELVSEYSFLKNSFCKIAKFCHPKKIITELRTKENSPKTPQNLLKFPSDTTYFKMRERGA
jgi:hypothetical protein